MTSHCSHIIGETGLVKISQVINSIFRSCTYLLSRDGCTWLVDCGDVDSILPLIEGRLKGVLLTHAHFDHIYGLNHLLALFPDISIYTNLAGLEGLKNDKYNFSRYHEDPFVIDTPANVKITDDGEFVSLFDGVKAQGIYTPGHSPCCVTWMVDEALFTGDSYIPGVKTVTNFPHSNKEMARQSEDIIKNLALNHIVYPGHAPLVE